MSQKKVSDRFDYDKLYGKGAKLKEHFISPEEALQTILGLAFSVPIHPTRRYVSFSAINLEVLV